MQDFTSIIPGKSILYNSIEKMELWIVDNDPGLF